MHREHIKLVRDVLTRTANRQYVDPQEYGLALLACDEALADQPAPTDTATVERIAIQRNLALRVLGLPLNASPDEILARGLLLDATKKDPQ